MLLGAGCTRAIDPLVRPGASAVALTGGSNTSMVYLARTSSGVVAIDLGWWGADAAVRRALGDLGAGPVDVTDVFLTHGHRDHVGAWRLARGSRFHVADGEVPRLLGVEAHRGWIARVADWAVPPSLPRDGQIDVRTFSRDTAFVLGADTLRAFPVPGHTPGSAAYLFRGVLFVGDAVTFTARGGFAPARRGYSDDRPQAVESLGRLWARLPAGDVDYVCTAHAHCARFDAAFLDDVRQ